MSGSVGIVGAAGAADAPEGQANQQQAAAAKPVLDGAHAPAGTYKMVKIRCLDPNETADEIAIEVNGKEVWYGTSISTGDAREIVPGRAVSTGDEITVVERDPVPDTDDVVNTRKMGDEGVYDFQGDGAGAFYKIRFVK